MLTLILATSIISACPVRLLYSNATQAASIDIHGQCNAVEQNNLGKQYYEPTTPRCTIRIGVNCSGLAKRPFLPQHNLKDHVVFMFESPRCALQYSDADSYVHIASDAYMPLGTICKPATQGLVCYGETKLALH